LNPEASIGGPIVRDRVWFFGDALRNMNRNQPLGAGNFQPGVDARYGWNLFGKITATPLSNQTATFRYTNSYQDQRNSPNVVASQAFLSPEAAAFQYRRRARSIRRRASFPATSRTFRRATGTATRSWVPRRTTSTLSEPTP
jgi:hypothetical protein